MVFRCFSVCRSCVPNWQSRPPEWQTPVAALLGDRRLPSRFVKRSHVVASRRKSSQVAEQWNVWSNRGACSCWGRYENQIAEMEMFMKQTWEERPKWFYQVAAAKHSITAWIYFNRIKRSSPFSTKKKEKDLNKRRFRRIKFERLCHVLVSCVFVDPWPSLQTSHLTSVLYGTWPFLGFYRVCVSMFCFFPKYAYRIIKRDVTIGLVAIDDRFSQNEIALHFYEKLLC